MAGINTADINELHVALKATPCQANRVVAVVSAMFGGARKNDAAGWAIEDKVNPAKGVERYDEDRRECWLTEDEMSRLGAALDAFPERAVADLKCSEKQKAYLQREGERIVAAIRLLMLTGSRAQEVLGARWSEFDLDRGTWTKPSHRTKQKRTETPTLRRGSGSAEDAAA